MFSATIADIWSAAMQTRSLAFGSLLSRPRPLHDKSTREEVLRYAHSIQNSEPGFASDLMAAANRAE